MEQSNISVRVNSTDKKEFELFCNKIGINISSAINMFIKTVLREQRIPFEIKTDDSYIYEKLAEAESEIKKTNKRYTTEELQKSVEGIIKSV